MNLRRSIATASLLAVALTPLAACGASPGPEEPTVLRLAAGSIGITFDPSQTTSNINGAWHIAAVYDSLFALPEGTGVGGDGLEPNIATEWEYSEGGTLLSIRIRDDVIFTDGSPLDAEAVKANIEQHRSPDSIHSPNFAGVEEVTVTGDNELQLRLANPSPRFLNILANMPLANPATIADHETLAAEPAGSGPYLLDDYTTEVSYSFVRNPDYWNTEAYPFDRVEITILQDITATVNALKSGQVDVGGIDSTVAAEVEAAGFQVLSTTAIWAGLILGDLRGEISPPIGNLKVRQAIYMALDRVAFTEAVEGKYGNASNQIGSEGQEGYYLSERADQYAYDIDAARELLAEAGYPDGFDIDIPHWPALNEKYQPYYDQAFTDLGIRVNWVTVNNDNWLAEYTSGKYSVLPMINLATDTPVYFEPDDFMNPWHNNEAEDLLNAINTSTSEEEFTEAIGRLNEKILDEAWLPILTHLPAITAFKSDITLTANGNTQVPLRNIRPAQ